MNSQLATDTLDTSVHSFHSFLSRPVLSNFSSIYIAQGARGQGVITTGLAPYLTSGHSMTEGRKISPTSSVAGDITHICICIIFTVSFENAPVTVFLAISKQ